MGDLPRNHHYVPRGYLKFFSNSVSKDVWQINVYDKISKKCFSSNIENVAAQRDYYRITGKTNEFELEAFFSENVETELPIVIGNVISFATLTKDRGCIFNEDIKSKLSKIIVTQLLRTPVSRKWSYSTAKDSASKWTKDFKKVYYEKLNPAQKSFVNKYHMNELMYREFEQAFISDEDRLLRFQKHLLKRKWVLYRNTFSKIIPYITSDNPVVFFNLDNNSSEWGSNGLAVEGTVIYFPLNDYLMLCLYPATGWLSLTMEFINNSVVNLQESENDILHVAQLNRIQLNQCYRQVFSKTDYFKDISEK